MTLRFCRCLTCLKQDVPYDLLYAALQTSAWQIWQVWFLFFWFLFTTELLSWYISKHNTTSSSLTNIFFVSHIQDGSFWGCSRIGVQKCHLHKNFHTYPKMMKLCTVIPYLTKIQNIHKSCDTPIKFCWHVVMWPKSGNSNISMREVIITSVL